MKYLLLAATFMFPFCVSAQPEAGKRNIFIITIDGFRWHEVFSGAEAALINNPKYTQDTALAKAMYWDTCANERRKKLLPFFWNVIAKKGQLYGNRLLGSKADVKNRYKLSYAGYNEILTGFADPHLIPNTPVNNRNINVLEYLNTQPGYSSKVAAFTSWNIFPYILNRDRNGLTVNSGYESPANPMDTVENLIQQVQESVVKKQHTRYDQLTFLSAAEYIKSNHPKVFFLGLGETDEMAHLNRYDLYLQQAVAADRMIAELWYFVQTDPQYKDNTIFIITTDHGRGSKPRSWHTHGILTRGSGATWLAMLGPGIPADGEIQDGSQLYSNQLVATMNQLLGVDFQSPHPIGKPLPLRLSESNFPTTGFAMPFKREKGAK